MSELDLLTDEEREQLQIVKAAENVHAAYFAAALIAARAENERKDELIEFADELAHKATARGMPFEEFAIKSGMGRERASSILLGMVALTRTDAVQISRALGTSRSVWTSLQQQYDEWKQSEKESE